MGAVVYLLVFRPLRNHRPVAKAVASIGLMGVLTAVVTYQVGHAGRPGQPDLPAEPRDVPGRQHLDGPPVAGRHDHRPRHRADRDLPLHPLRPGHSGLGRDRGGSAGQWPLARPHRTGQLDHQFRRLRHRRHPDRPARPPAARDLHAVHRAGTGRRRGRALPLARLGHHRRAGHRRARVALGLRQRCPPGLPRRRRRADPAHPGARRAGRARPDDAEPGHADAGHTRARPAPALAHRHGHRGDGARPRRHLLLHRQRPRRPLRQLHHGRDLALARGGDGLHRPDLTGTAHPRRRVRLHPQHVRHLLGHSVPGGADPFRPRRRGGRRRDRHPGPARPRAHARRRHTDVRGGRGGHLVQQQLH